ncbi:hypothetical protein THASP1DRAFT_30298 [Thamnocephalis sphaerospora]|uniref:Uncharacterized protein n=1 Tax=Thamnocephalis sphaerospora TaxID=78915 RepID=A0A4P9XPH1_9FUNG|nr:hypothetical protein THASP1DRAFT_30298 [Thamnocephalis sphaerospora]|eukprot:RKP07886.1 hypothetical protein THASP1DRAFT_30298 [Thamnocephalis sphaerospora]
MLHTLKIVSLLVVCAGAVQLVAAAPSYSSTQDAAVPSEFQHDAGHAPLEAHSGNPVSASTDKSEPHTDEAGQIVPGPTNQATPDFLKDTLFNLPASMANDANHSGNQDAKPSPAADNVNGTPRDLSQPSSKDAHDDLFDAAEDREDEKYNEQRDVDDHDDDDDADDDNDYDEQPKKPQHNDGHNSSDHGKSNNDTADHGKNDNDTAGHGKHDDSNGSGDHTAQPPAVPQDGSNHGSAGGPSSTQYSDDRHDNNQGHGTDEHAKESHHGADHDTADQHTGTIDNSEGHHETNHGQDTAEQAKEVHYDAGHDTTGTYAASADHFDGHSGNTHNHDTTGHVEVPHSDANNDATGMHTDAVQYSEGQDNSSHDHDASAHVNEPHHDDHHEPTGTSNVVVYSEQPHSGGHGSNEDGHGAGDERPKTYDENSHDSISEHVHTPERSLKHHGNEQHASEQEHAKDDDVVSEQTETVKYAKVQYDNSQNSDAQVPHVDEPAVPHHEDAQVPHVNENTVPHHDDDAQNPTGQQPSAGGYSGVSYDIQKTSVPAAVHSSANDQAAVQHDSAYSAVNVSRPRRKCHRKQGHRPAVAEPAPASGQTPATAAY